ncbi:von Willebrand factor D and EGF domain-containing protein [Stylophora pistillata]|uniref:von Willebrand factor D and EGF domain-containing protein n=1 Tax=Stylophora pistillata TaxID=50429 RepID=A0A2B4R8E1_STYPI|nr:von Willebrand factor D and EGF domain-containing protein [Stylophora pistillata]
MSLGRFLLKSAILVFVFSHSYGQQPCNNCCQKPNHKEIDNSRRSVESKWKSGQAALCDKDLAEGWYRFTSFVGGRMPTKKVNIDRCGTQSPIWLDGTTGNHPASPNDPVVSIRACVNFRDGKPCPYGQKGTSFATCSAGPQKLSSIYLGHPEIKVKDSEEEKVSLLCVVPIDKTIRTWTNVTYEIEWYADGKKTDFTEKPFCVPAKGKKEYSKPCPDKETIHSVLSSNHYEPGQWVTPSTLIISECKEPFYQELTLTPMIPVYVVQKDQPIHKCLSVTDPHYRMLDKQNVLRERWHDFFGFGDFVLYHNKEKDFEVLTRQWACNNAKSITCNCGVIIRDHNDLIKFSCCGNPRKKFRDSTTPIVVDIPRAKCLAPGITLLQVIQGINSKYERQPSHFDQLPSEINKQDSQLERACACDETTQKRNETKCVDGVPAFWSLAGIDKFNRIKRCDNDPNKRDLQWSDDLTEEDYELFLEPLDSEAHKRQRRSANVISKENATRYCAERLAETNVGKMCAKLGTNVQALVTVCASDIEYTGDISFAVGAVSMLMNECNDVIIENITVNSNDTGNFTAPKTPKMPPTMQKIAQLLCPNDCTFNGKCVNGSCVCKKDYTAKDCSISVYQKPFIAR